MPKVSVVTPSYNAAQFLGEAVKSVLDQTYQDFELVIVDDGSTDNTREVVSGFQDRRITYIYQDNRGAPAAYNRGYKASTGRYVLFLDADDVLLKDALQKSVQGLEQHPDVGFSYGQAWIMDEKGHIYRLRKSSFQEFTGLVDRREQIRELLFTCLITPSTVMARRECLENVRVFNEEMTSIAEDNHLYIRLTKKYPVYYIAEPLVKYRIHSEQLHKKVEPQLGEKAVRMVLDEVFNDPEYAFQFQEWKGPAYFRRYCQVSSWAYGKDMSQARHYMRKALKAYPQVTLRKDGLAIIFKYGASLLPVQLWSNLRSLKWRLKGNPVSVKE